MNWYLWFIRCTRAQITQFIHVNPERSSGGTNGEPPSEASQLLKGVRGSSPGKFQNLYCKWCNLRYSWAIFVNIISHIIVIKLARLFNYLIWGPWVRVAVEPWGLGFWVALTLTVTQLTITHQIWVKTSRWTLFRRRSVNNSVAVLMLLAGCGGVKKINSRRWLPLV